MLCFHMLCNMFRHKVMSAILILYKIVIIGSSPDTLLQHFLDKTKSGVIGLIHLLLLQCLDQVFKITTVRYHDAAFDIRHVNSSESLILLFARFRCKTTTHKSNVNFFNFSIFPYVTQLKIITITIFSVI
jgi:hypothetical protein